MDFKSCIYFAALLFWGCKPSVVQYKVSNKEVGPIMVFVIPDKKQENKGSGVSIQNRLGVISESEMGKDFVFTSIENGSNIKIAEVGKEGKVNPHDRYIFRLLKGTIPSKCSYGDMNFVTFFVGTKLELEEWDKKYKDEFEFFDSTGNDWCKYYKSKLSGSASN
jgi:hypothetical protein